eukprot:CAMPEP_0167790752 /NCGR_PEP_ID=MMETSP0111_2-20121227/11521_1 /TAXON_ID=91324 /ORGANISM="Lotharella globosa, Strain CCCM811" /LENGTH=631 /DNA_ID=CAMNT_0007683277 /DNA_START=321 /DNA_END=2216 /DNA_ORIENTATION=-
MYQPSFIVNEEAADPFEGQDGLEEFNRIRAEGILDAVDAEHMGGGLSPGVPQRNRLRSESVDVLWLSQKRTVKLTSAWWNLKQRDVDSLRRGRAPVSPTGPRRQRKRSVVSPMLVQRQRVPGIPGVPSSSSYLGRPQATSNRAADTKESKAGGSGYRYHKHGKRHTSSIWGRIWRGDSEGTAIDTEKERKKWRDMKQVDRMYQNNLFRRYQARKLRSRAASQAQTPDTMSVASGTSEPTSLSSSAHLRHRTTPAAVPQRPRSNAQANGGEADRIRQERFWRETVIPSWSEIADAPMVRKLWDQYGVPPKLRRHVWPLALGCREDSENGAVSYEACLKREQDRCDKMDVKSPEGVNGSEALGSLSFGAARRESIKQDLARMSELERGTKGAPHRQKIKQVLLAYCAFRPGVTYVQGMSYLVLMMLWHMSPKEAFKCLCNLLDCDYFHAYLDMDVQQIRFRFKIFNELFRINLKRLHRHFKNMGLVPDCYLMEWLMCLHSKQLNTNAAARVWDGYLIHGEIYVFQVAIAILSLLQPVLLKRPLNVCMKILRSKFDKIEEAALINTARLVRVPPAITASLLSGGAPVLSVRTGTQTSRASSVTQQSVTEPNSRSFTPSRRTPDISRPIIINEEE